MLSDLVPCTQNPKLYLSVKEPTIIWSQGFFIRSLHSLQVLYTVYLGTGYWNYKLCAGHSDQEIFKIISDSLELLY